MKQPLPVHEPTADQVIDCFNLRFSASEGTILVGGADEPYYEPGSPNVIYFREDFIRSALHEVAHWCVAGSTRRTLPDYGYWYAPDGRDEAQQTAFYSVEVKPQAVEKAFCMAVGIPFKVSVDNLSISLTDPAIAIFAEAVEDQFAAMMIGGLPHRAEVFRHALSDLALCHDRSQVSISGEQIQLTQVS